TCRCDLRLLPRQTTAQKLYGAVILSAQFRVKPGSDLKKSP
ncbi:hypothetical protein TorRG33x02_179740, partial [Trema orientale]